MEYIDFHTHLSSYKDYESMIRQLCGFEGIIVSAAVDYDSYKKTVGLKEKIEKLSKKCMIVPTIGIHPSKVKAEKNKLSIYKEVLNDSSIIGEIGMDFCWYKDASSLEQENIFRFFLEHCNDKKKYCVIHTKDAEEKICRILEEYPDAKPIIHWYDGPTDIYQEFIKRNYMQTFGCETIRSSHIQNLLKITPENLILAETDNPSSEKWLGGSDDSIYLIKRIYDDLAEILKKEKNEITHVINKNSKLILGIK